MKIREFQILLEVLKRYIDISEHLSCFEPIPFHFTRPELIEIIKWKYGGPALDALDLSKLNDQELIQAAGEEEEVLRYFIEKFERQIRIISELTQSEKDTFFDKYSLGDHYLNTKPIEVWDEYDHASYIALIFKYGKAKKVYGIYLSHVQDKELPFVTTQPSYFFCTPEEAKAEMEKILLESDYQPEELSIKSLYKFN